MCRPAVLCQIWPLGIILEMQDHHIGYGGTGGIELLTLRMGQSGITNCRHFSPAENLCSFKESFSSSFGGSLLLL